MNERPWSAVNGQYAVETPEQVDLHLPLAGLGSRFLATLLDILIQVLANIVIVIVVAIVFSIPATQRHADGLSATAQKWFVAFLILVYFLLYWGYYSLFEAFHNGQTPGKRVMKIRVIKDSGRQITFFEALARNLLRVVDLLPGMYLVGAISILCTRQNKRLGDLVADTIVVHERVEEWSGYLSVPVAYASSVVHGELAAMPADCVSRLGSGELLLIDTYLSRALDLPLAARAVLASRMVDGLCAKMGVPVPVETPPERTLESLAYALRSRGGVAWNVPTAGGSVRP